MIGFFPPHSSVAPRWSPSKLHSVLFGVDTSWLESQDDASVRREEDWPVGSADWPRSRSQDGVAERRALQEVVGVRVMRRTSCTQSQRVRGRCGRHCCCNSQRAGQEPCTQNFGEILGEGQRRLKTQSEAKRRRVLTTISLKRLQNRQNKQIYFALLN